MPIESVSGIWDLDETWPLGTDPASQGDDHDRLTKDAIKKTFPSITEPVTVTAKELNSGGTPTGALVAFGGAAAPDGWLLCNGAAVSRSAYADLYNVIGQSFGAGNGTSTFNVPDMRNRVAACVGTGNAMGDEEGKDTWVAADLPSHSHAINSSGAHSHQIKHRQSQAQAYSSSSKTVYDYENETYTANTETDGAHTHTVQNTGSGGDNRQATLYAQYIIKT